MEKLRLVLRKILIVILVIWMIVVFGLSNQTGEDSGGLSRKVANFFARNDTVQAEKIEPMIRKIAHMTEYAVGGMLFYGIMLTYPENSRKKRIIASLVFVILYACSDELHQTFVNARNGSFLDVCIDTFGGSLGILGMFIIECSIIAMDNKVKEDMQNIKIDK